MSTNNVLVNNLCSWPLYFKRAVGAGDVVKEYRKEKMACRHALEQKCDLAGECAFFKEAPEILEKNTQWYEL